METGTRVFMYDGKFVDTSKMSLEEINEMLEKVDGEIAKLESELNESLFDVKDYE